MNKTSQPFILPLFAILFWMSASASAGTLSFVAMEPITPTEQTVNINTANAQELSEKLVGIGVKKAQLIVDYRATQGRFSKVEDLQAVKGIGPKTLEKNRHRIKL